MFPTYQGLQKGALNLFYLDFELFAKILKIWFLQTHRNQVFTFLLMSRNLKKIKKILNTVSRHC